jgi:hypothetical protein
MSHPVFRPLISKSSAACLIVAGILLLTIAAIPSAQRRRGGGDDGTLPIATNTILQNPDTYYGKPVTLSAGVEKVFSLTTFVVDQRKAIGEAGVQAVGAPILVIAPYLSAPLDPKHYLLIRGQLVKFDAVAIAGMPGDFKNGLSPEVTAAFQGRPVLLATSILTSTYAELARKPLPPAGAEELAMSAAMKIIGPVSAAARTAAQESNTAVITENAPKLRAAFTTTETAWDDLGLTLPAQMARDARDLVDTMEREAAAGRWDIVKLSAGALGDTCGSCHSTYRERQDDGTFRFKFSAF